MKTIQKRWLPLFLLAALTFLFPACEKNNSSVDGSSGGEDTSGLITVKMRNSENGETTILVGGGYFYINKANNFANSGYGNANTEICDMGTKKLSAIKTVPTSGWAREVAVTPNHRYVIRNEYTQWNSSIQGTEQKVAYLKLYVVDYTTNTSGGIIGAEVQYCEWTPEQ